VTSARRHRVGVEQIPVALTAGNFVYDDGSTQVFDADLASSIASRRYYRAVRNRSGIAHWCTSLGSKKSSGSRSFS
jgi:hypothetical protein